MPASPLSAYLLVAHGSRDPRPQAAMERLAEQLRQPLHGKKMTAIAAPALDVPSQSRDCNPLETEASPWIGTATLELANQPLHHQIAQWGQQVYQAGCHQLNVVPLFLLPGVHVMEDLPAELKQAEPHLPQDFAVRLAPYLGSHPQLALIFAAQQQQWNADAWILMAHGSQRSGGNQPVEAIAQQLGASLAYWSITPQLWSQIEQLVQAGHRRIGILPYFLFEGGITDAIASQVADLSRQFPDVVLHLASPLGNSSDLANLVWDLVA